MFSQKAIILFAKQPREGKVKTRLGAEVGMKTAAKLYAQMLHFTLQMVQTTPHTLFLFLPKEESLSEDFPTQGMHQKVQSGGDLGNKMCCAFEEVFQEGFDSAVIIGTDCLTLQPSHLEFAFEQLQEKDVVLGPSKDGGYYLLGLKKAHAEIFQNIEWSTSIVLEQTTQRLESENLTYSFLEEMDDLDTLDSLQSFMESYPDLLKL